MRLSLVPSDELLTELISRYDHAAFVGFREGYESGRSLRVQEYSGDTTYLIGMLEQLKTILVDDSMSELEESDG